MLAAAPAVGQGITILIAGVATFFATAAIIDAINRSKVSGGFKAQVLTEAKKMKKDDEPKEPTPATAPELFEVVSNSINPKKTKTFRKIGTTEHWCEDNLHYNHFEVFKTQKDLEKNKKTREVWWDGRLKAIY